MISLHREKNTAQKKHHLYSYTLLATHINKKQLAQLAFHNARVHLSKIEHDDQKAIIRLQAVMFALIDSLEHKGSEKKQLFEDMNQKI